MASAIRRLWKSLHLVVNSGGRKFRSWLSEKDDVVDKDERGGSGDARRRVQTDAPCWECFLRNSAYQLLFIYIIAFSPFT